MAQIHIYARQHPSQRSAYEIYAELDLGEGSYALAPATEAKRAVKEAIRRKHPR